MMKHYQIFIQDTPYKIIESAFVSDVLKELSFDIQHGMVPNFDNTKPASIKIIPVS
jgi:hypothetical protein